jgi:hypothetical protein
MSRQKIQRSYSDQTFHVVNRHHIGPYRAQKRAKISRKSARRQKGHPLPACRAAKNLLLPGYGIARDL